MLELLLLPQLFQPVAPSKPEFCSKELPVGGAGVGVGVGVGVGAGAGCVPVVLRLQSL